MRLSKPLLVFAALAILIAGVTGNQSSYKNTAQLSSCVTPLTSDSAATKVISQAYQNWKSTYITTIGAGGAERVQRDSTNNYDTVSEGIGYGMLFAAYNNDQYTFNELWNYEQTHLDPDGLMNWEINSSDQTTGYNAATDADEDMALALVMADKSWGGYTQAANHQISLIKQYEVETGSDVLKPGDVWGGSNLTNPSYLDPGYYQVFSSYSGDTSWNQVAAESYNIISSIDQNTPAGTTGLVPDWSDYQGNAVSGMSHDFGYDAVRNGLRMASSDSWYCSSVANNQLDLLNSTYQKIGLTKVENAYSLTGQATSNTAADTAPFVMTGSAAAMTSTDSNYKQSAWSALVNSSAGNYYSDSLRLLGLMVTGGQFTNPLNTPMPTITTSSTVPSSNVVSSFLSNANINVWWPTVGSIVSGTQPFKAEVPGDDISTYSMYWQVDGGQLNLMSDNYQGYPHKQSNVDLSNWSWHGSGPYTINFVAKDGNGSTIATDSINIDLDN